MIGRDPMVMSCSGNCAVQCEKMCIGFVRLSYLSRVFSKNVFVNVKNVCDHCIYRPLRSCTGIKTPLAKKKKKYTHSCLKTISRRVRAVCISNDF